jgi:MFS transporter, OHS family, lactose permease
MRRKVVGFGILVFFTFFANAMINTQGVPFLIEVGYSSSQRGNIMAFYALVAMVGQFVVGYLCDRHKTIKRYFILMAIFFAGFIVMTFTLSDQNYLVHFLLMGNTLALSRVVVNLMETWIIEVDGMYPYFGSIRSFGSLGWALSSLLAGFIILEFGYDWLAYVAAGLNMVVVFASFFFEDANKQTATKIKLQDTVTLFKNPRFVLLLMTYLLIFVVYNADSIAVTDLIMSVGGTEADVGLKWFVQALSELPFMVMGTYILTRFSAKWMLGVGSFFLGMRFILYGLFPTTSLIIWLSLLQMLSFPFTLISQKELVLAESPKELRTTAQMIFISVTSGLSAILSPLISGYLGEVFELRSIVMGMGLFMIVPLLMGLFYKPSS